MNDPQPSLTSTPSAVEPEPSQTAESYNPNTDGASDSPHVRVYDRPERTGKVSPLIILTALIVTILLAIFVFQFIF